MSELSASFCARRVRLAGGRGGERRGGRAGRLGLVHPVSGKNVEWEAPMPDDMRALLKVLEKDVKG